MARKHFLQRGEQDLRMLRVELHSAKYSTHKQDLNGTLKQDQLCRKWDSPYKDNGLNMKRNVREV